MGRNMHGFWLVLKHELVTTVGRRSFQLAVFGMPIIALSVYGFLALYRRSGFIPANPQNFTDPQADQREPTAKPEGYVDYPSLTRDLPASAYEISLIAFPNEDSAKRALLSGEISQYYLIPPDYIASGEIFLVREDAPQLGETFPSSEFQNLLTLSLLGGNEDLAYRVTTPFVQVSTPQVPVQATDSQFLVAFFLPFGVTLFFYITILMSSSLLLGSLTIEKENRILEILLTSISPGQLFSGKILGLGVAGLLQTFIWLGTGLLILGWSRGSLQLPHQANLTLSFFSLGILFFILGYGLYACLMASIGALVKNLREASQFSLLLLMPMLVPVLTTSLLVSDPSSPLVVGLSLFPLTSPVSMMARLAITPVPAWQLIISVALLILAIFATLKLVAGLFRLQTLLAGSPWSARLIWTRIKGN